MQERLGQQQRAMAEERARLKEVITRMEVQLGEQQRQLEKVGPPLARSVCLSVHPSLRTSLLRSLTHSIAPSLSLTRSCCYTAVLQ